MDDEKTIRYAAFFFVGIALLVILLGFYPVPLLETLNVSVDNLIDNYETDIKTIGLN